MSRPLPSVDLPVALKFDGQRYVGEFFIDMPAS
jgi:hypothetical protein